MSEHTRHLGAWSLILIIIAVGILYFFFLRTQENTPDEYKAYQQNPNIIIQTPSLEGPTHPPGIPNPTSSMPK